jgi:hypothetical protein
MEYWIARWPEKASPVKARLVRSAGPEVMVRSAGQPGRVPNITYRPLEFFNKIHQKRSFLSAQQR